MKKLSTVFWALMVAFVALTCGKDGSDDSVQAHFRLEGLSSSTIELISSNSYEESFVISSSHDWELDAESKELSWVKLEPAQGTVGNTNVTLSVLRNAQDIPREAEIRINNLGTSEVYKINLSQSALLFKITPEQKTVPVQGEVIPVKIEVEEDAIWDVVIYDDAWASYDIGGGTGPATVNITCEPNEDMDPRSTSAHFFIRGIGGDKILTINQSGTGVEAPSLEVLPKDNNIGKDGGSFDLTITTNKPWQVYSSPSWATVSKSSGDGSETITVNCEQNTKTEVRRGEITIEAGGIYASVNIIQDAAPEAPILTLSTYSQDIVSGGESFDLVITSNNNWNVESGYESWITLSKESGTGSETITIDCALNEFMRERSAELTFISGELTQTLTINQAEPLVPTLSFSRSTVDVPASFVGVETIEVISNTAWQMMREYPTWCEVSPTFGVGNTTVTITFKENIYARRQYSDLLTFAYSFSEYENAHARLEIIQQPAPAWFEASPNGTIHIPIEGGEQVFNIKSNCYWYLKSHNEHWISVIGDDSGTNDGSITIKIDPNDSEQLRTAKIAFDGLYLEEEYEITISQVGEQLPDFEKEPLK